MRRVWLGGTPAEEVDNFGFRIYENSTIQALVKVLATHSELDHRRAAAYVLGVRHDKSVIEPLLKALSDGNYEVRMEAALALGGFQEKRIFEALAQLVIRDPSSILRSRIAIALRKFGKNSITPLTKALLDEQWRVRGAAAQSLGELREALVANSLFRLRRDEDFRVRWIAISSLGKIRDERIVELLVPWLTDQHPKVRRKAVEVFEHWYEHQAGEEGVVYPRVVDALIFLLKDADLSIRTKAAKMLQEIQDPRSIDALFEALRDDSGEVQRLAGVGLQSMGGRATDLLIQQFLFDNDTTTRNAALRLLLPTDNPRVESAIAHVLKNEPDQQFRFSVAQMITPVKAESQSETLLLAALEAFAHILMHSDIQQLRQNAAQHLVRLKAPQTTKILIKAIQDPAPAIRILAINYMSQNTESQALTSLVEALIRDQEFNVRNAAAAALGAIGGVEAYNALVQSLKLEKNAQVQTSVVTVLARTSDKQFLRPLADFFIKEANNQGSINACRAAITGISNIGGDEAFKILLKCLQLEKNLHQQHILQTLRKHRISLGITPLSRVLKNSKNHQVQLEIIRLLQSSGDRRAIKPLIEILVKEPDNHQHNSVNVRKAAAVAIGTFGGISAFRGLIKSLQVESNQQVQIAVISALQRIRNKQAVPQLIDILLNGAHPQSRIAAAKALREIGGPKAFNGLLQGLQTISNSSIQISIIQLLSGLGNRKAVQPLIKILKETEYHQVRIAAIKSLESFGSTKVFKVLLQEFQRETHHQVQLMYIETFHRIGNQQIIKPLEKLFEETKHNQVRIAAYNLLIRRGWTPSDPAKLASLFIAMRKWSELERLGDGAVEPLREYINNERNYSPVISAIQILGRIKTRGAAKALVSYLVRGFETQFQSYYVARVRDSLTSTITSMGQLAAEELLKTITSEDIPKPPIVNKVFGILIMMDRTTITKLGPRIIKPLVSALQSSSVHRGRIRGVLQEIIQSGPSLVRGAMFEQWVKEKMKTKLPITGQSLPEDQVSGETYPQEEWVRASEVIHQVREKSSRDSVLLLELEAECHCNAGNWEEAAKCYSQLVEVNPGDINYLVNLGFAYMKAGARQKAIKCYEQIMEHHKEQLREREKRSPCLGCGMVFAITYPLESIIKCRHCGGHFHTKCFNLCIFKENQCPKCKSQLGLLKGDKKPGGTTSK